MNNRTPLSFFNSAITGFFPLLLALISKHENTDNFGAQSMTQSQELTELKNVLIKKDKILKSKQLQIDTHVKINFSLNQKLINLNTKFKKINYLVLHDPLTGLPNRYLLMDRLKQAVAQSDRQHQQVALLFIDLNKFKSVNDRFGHSAGDTLLQQAAKRINASIRYGDTACRYGGDEFVVLLPNIDGVNIVKTVKEKLLNTLGQPYYINGHHCEINASIGSAVYAGNGQSCADFIQQADNAMYRIKEGGY